MALTAKDEVLTAIDTAAGMLAKPLTPMSVFLLRQTLAFARERVEQGLTVRKSRKAEPAEPPRRTSADPHWCPHVLVLLAEPEPDPKGGDPFLSQCSLCDVRFKVMPPGAAP